MERRIIVFLVFEGLMKSLYGQTPTLQIYNASTEEGSSFTLNCSVTINDAITFKLDNVVQGSCGAPFLGILGSCTPNTITQSLIDSVTSWTISPAEPAHHGSWKCTLGTTDSVAVDFKVFKLPGAVSTPNGISSDTTVNDTSSRQIIVDVDCLISENGPTVELEFVAAGTVGASVMMSCVNSSTNCSTCNGCSAYRCSHTLILDPVLSSGEITTNTAYTLQIKVGVTGTTQTFSTAIFSPHTITFERTRALKIVSLGSNELASTTYSLRCEIPNFNNNATWSKNGKRMSVLFVNGDNPEPTAPYSFRQDKYAIYVIFIELASSEHGQQWKCAHIGRTEVRFTVEVESSRRVAIESSVATVCTSLLVGIVSGLCVVFSPFVIISMAVAEKWYFSNRYVCRGTVLYGIHIVIVGAVCNLSSIIITVLVIVCRYPGQFNIYVTGLIICLFVLNPCLGFLVFRCIVAICGKKQWLHKIFHRNYECLSLAKHCGIQFTTDNMDMICFKVKASDSVHMTVFGQNGKVPLVDAILVYDDYLMSVVLEQNHCEPKHEYGDRVRVPTEYRTFFLKCENNCITVLNDTEENILEWTCNDRLKPLKIDDIVISNNMQAHLAMLKKTVSNHFTDQELQILFEEFRKNEDHLFCNTTTSAKTEAWKDLCSKRNAVNGNSHERTVEEIKERWNSFICSTTGNRAEYTVNDIDTGTVLSSNSWIEPAHLAMLKKTISKNVTEQELETLFEGVQEREDYLFGNTTTSAKTEAWKDGCSRINAANGNDHERTVEEMKERFTIKGNRAEDTVHDYDVQTVLSSSSWIEPGTDIPGYGNPAKWTFFVHQVGDRLNVNEEDSRTLKTVTLSIVILLPFALLVLILLSILMIYKQILSICKQDSSKDVIKNKKDTYGNGLVPSSVSCCLNSVTPNGKEDSLPNAVSIPENESDRTPRRGQFTFPAIKKKKTKANEAGKVDTTQKKKKKKSKKQKKTVQE